MLQNYLGRQPSIDGFIKYHNLENDAEYSFFLNTENIKQNIQHMHTQVVMPAEKKIENANVCHDYDDTSVSNRFSEIYDDEFS